MKNQRFILCWVMAICIFLTSACGVQNAPPSNPTETGSSATEPSASESNATEPQTVSYADLEMAPNYPEISDKIAYTTYYFDSEAGADDNDGLSASEPMKSLKAINRTISEVTADSPVRILIKAGSVYNGKLQVSGFEAADESPLIIDVYGKTGGKQYAKIIGDANSSCVLVTNSNVRISGLELTGETAYRGIYLIPQWDGAMKNVVISGNYCHDINFRVSDLEGGFNSLPVNGEAPSSIDINTLCPTERYGYQYGGIIAEADTPEFLGASWFENLWIENNLIERVSRTGIWIFSNWTYRPGCDWGNNRYHSDEVNYYPHKNVVVRSNRIEYAGGDSIVMGAVHDGWLESNTSYYAQYLGRAGYYNAGIWTHSCTNVTFQFNEAAYTYLRNGAGDGEGFDIDIACTDITFRYNYAHHNEGGGILLCNQSTWLVLYDENGDYVRDEDGLPMREKRAIRWSNVSLQNNVFADNLGSVVVATGYVSDFTFANNTVIIPGDNDAYKIVRSQDFNATGLPGSGWKFINNIFLSRGGKNASINTSFCSGYQFDSNVFWGFPEDFKATTEAEHGSNIVNMIITDPGISLDTPAEFGMSAMHAFKPTAQNMLVNASLLGVMNRYDAEGADVAEIQYFGAYGTIQ